MNIISGPLGVGKTTMINHLLQSRPRGERWAVLVNEYGLVGVDAALMSGASGEASQEGEETGVEIREVAGGCICCSAGLIFEVSLIRLLRRRPDRLLIEPTGLAALSGILDTLEKEGIREAVDVRSIVCLLDIGRLRDDIQREEVIDQIEAADVLLASRADLSSQEQLGQFKGWADQLFPPKRLVDQVERGKLPIELLDLVSHRPSAPARAGYAHGTEHEHDHHHHHDHHHQVEPSSGALEVSPHAAQPIISRAHHASTSSTVGWICWDQLTFDARGVSEWLTSLNRASNTQRVKAVVRTNEGWWRFNFIGEVEEQWPSGYRRDSRLEVIFEGGDQVDLEALERSLRACLISPSASL